MPGRQEETSRGSSTSRPPTPSRRRRNLRIAAAVAVLAGIFVGAFPQFASYSDAWRAAARIGPLWWFGLAVATVVAQVSAVWIYQAALPGLRLRDGLVQIETTSAIASTVPAGGAVAIAVSYRMFASFGFSDEGISTAVVVTGVWNVAAKLVLPVVAVGLLALTAHPPEAAVVAAGVGAAIAVVAGVGLWLTFRSETVARRLGRGTDRAVNWLGARRHRPASDRIERAALDFRAQTVDTVRGRGRLLTGAALGAQLVAIALVLLVVRSVGIPAGRVSFVAVLTSFSMARLAGALPITPGGLGTVDSAFIGALAAFGAKTSSALAADLVWRTSTYLFPTLVGVVAYVIWLRRDAARPRTAATSPPANGS